MPRFFSDERARLLVVLTSIVVLILASLLVAVLNERQYKSQVAAAAKVQSQILADTVSAALTFGDRAALKQSVNALKANSEVDAVGVYDGHGHLAASFARSHLAGQLSDAITPARAPGQIIVYTPVEENGVRLGTVYLRNQAEPVTRRITRYIGPGLLVLMASLLVAVMALNSRALSQANRELTAEMAEREKVEAALRQSQKLEAIGRLTGGIAHDFNNMLAIVLGSLDLMLRRQENVDPRTVRLAQQAMEGARRASELTKRLLAFSRLQPLKPTTSDIGKTVTEMTDLLRRTLGETIAVETVLAGGLWRAHVDLPQLETAIVNLSINARDAMPGGGKLTLETANTYLDRVYAETESDLTPGQYVMIAITDTGTGMAPEVLAQVFEPFFTTKPVGVGTGLGLSQVHGFIKQSGGHIRIYSEVGSGTTVKLYLPRSTAEVESKPTISTKSTKRVRRNITVLVVEDEAGVRDFAVEALNELGYDVVSAPGPVDGLLMLDAHPEVSILLSDVVMPEMNGRQLAEEAVRRRPTLKVVFMTGYTRNAIVHNGVLDAGTHLLNKPFTVDQLGEELNAIDKRPANTR